jgi:hypothetical protein
MISEFDSAEGQTLSLSDSAIGHSGCGAGYGIRAEGTCAANHGIHSLTPVPRGSGLREWR